jgi:endo-1,4-beta-xylanase
MDPSTYRPVSRRGFLRATGSAGLFCGSPLVFSSRSRGESLEANLPTGLIGLRVLAAKKRMLIGTAFSSRALADDPTYGEIIAREFNCIVAENDMKLNVIQRKRGEFDFAPAESMMAFAAKNAMKVRAVPLVWHEGLPSWAKDKVFPRAEAMAILREHIFTVMRQFKGRVIAWDVLNEGLDNKTPGLRKQGPWFHSIGPDYVELVYQWAHVADPEAVLFYNDFDMDGMSESADRCYLWIKELLARNVPIHGIGLQYHVKIDDHPSVEEVTRNIRRFNDLGLVVHITELDVWLPPKATPADFRLQAAIYRGVFETALAARNCPVVTLWGVSDRYSWVPGISNGQYDHALILDRAYRPKPAYDAIAAVLSGNDSDP